MYELRPATKIYTVKVLQVSHSSKCRHSIMGSTLCTILSIRCLLTMTYWLILIFCAQDNKENLMYI